MGEQSPIRDRMRPVLDKLALYGSHTKDAFRRNISDKEIYRQSTMIGKLMDVFINDPEIAKQSVKAAYDIYSGEHKSEEGWNILQMTKLGKALGATHQIDDVRQKEGFQTVFSAYLFAENRRLFQQSKDVATYDVKKEARQIESVVRALVGQHGQIGTGEGKTSVILPITALVQAYSTEGKKAVFSADSTLRTQEFVKNIAPYKQIVEQAGLTPLDITQAPDTNNPDNTEVNSLRGKMEREALLSQNGEYSKETKRQMQDQYWQSYFEAQIKQNELKQQEANAPTSVKIELNTHDNLVWQYMEDENGFKKSKTPIIMDEAHAPADRGTPYQRVSESLSQSPEETRRAASEWLIHYVVGKTIVDGDIRFSKGSGELTERGEERLAEISIHNIDRKGTPYEKLFKEGLEIIAKSYGISGEDKRLLKKQITIGMHSLFNEKDIDTNDQSFKEYVGTIGGSIAKMYFERNEAFTTSQDGKLIIRDGYQDELLASHEYTREMALATLGLVGTYKVVPHKRASGSLKYASFIHGSADRIVCFSGTLKDDEKETPFGHFLEKETGRKIFVMEKPEKKKFPRPHLDETASLAVQSLLSAMKKDGRNMLIIDNTNIDDAKKTAEVFKKEFGEGKVVFIGSKEAGSAESEAEYEKRVAQSLSDLAEGNIKAIVSTGSIGTGMNIVKKDGGYPDIKIGILGVPHSKLQIKQIIGRRRAVDSVDQEDYFWHVGKDRLTKHISTYLTPSEVIQIPIPIHIGGKSQRAILEQVLEVSGNPEKLLPLMLDIIQHTQNQKNIDTQYDIEYDNFYKTVLRASNEYMRAQLIKNLFPGRDEKSLSEEERFRLGKVTSLSGIPDSLYWDIQANLESVAYQSVGTSPSFAANHSTKVEVLKKATAESPFLRDRLDGWISHSYEDTRKYYDTVYAGIPELLFQDQFETALFTYPEEVTSFAHGVMLEQISPLDDPLPVKTYQGYVDTIKDMNPLYVSVGPRNPTYKIQLLEGGYQVHSPLGGMQFKLEEFPIKINDGRPIYTFHIAKNITERSTPGISST